MKSEVTMQKCQPAGSYLDNLVPVEDVVSEKMVHLNASPISR
jgi:hypothetical protein